MIQTASDLIDALGGTSATAEMTKNRVSTVHSWRQNGIPEARLDHLVLAAERAGKVVPSFHAADVMRGVASASSGKANGISAEVAA